MSLPTVSIVTPTYNRQQFIDQLLRCIAIQDYPAELIDVMILDDSPQPIHFAPHWQERLSLQVVRYEQRLPLGWKRNYLNQNAKGEIIIPFDDDDYYPATRVSHAVHQLQTSHKALAGSSLLFMWFPNTQRGNGLYLMGPFGENHSCNGAMAYTKQYAQTHQYIDDKTSGEEPSFTNNFKNEMIQLNPALTMLSIAHQQNTVTKKEINFHKDQMPNLEKFPQFLQSSWQDFVTDNESQQFYQQAFGLSQST